MSAESSGSSKSKDGLSLEQTSSPAPETDEVTGGKVDNACNNQAHSTTHCTQSQTNHTPILAHAQSTEGTNEVGTSCLDGLAKEGKQKDDLTSMTEEVSNSQQRHIEQSSHFEKICVIQSVNNEDSESSTESDDQSYELRLKAKEENQDKTFVIIYRRSENDPGDQSVEAVQVAKKVNHDNQRDTSDTTRRPKGNEQKGNDSGAIPRVRGVKLEQNNGCKVTDIYKRISENENDNDDEAMQRVEDGKHNQNNEFKDSAKRPSGNDIDDELLRVEDGKHDQNNEFKYTEKRPSGNDIDDDGAMQSVEDGKLEQKYGNKNTEERPSGNEKDHDKRTKPSVKNENNGDNDIEKRPFKYEKNDKGNMKTKVVKEESPDINMKTNDTERESRENEKKYHPDNATQSALIKKRQRSEKSLKDNGSEQNQNEMSGNTNNDGEWTEGKKGRDKRRPTCKSGDPDMNPSNVNTDGTDSTISEQDDNGAMPGAVMLPIDNSRDSSVMKNKGLGRIAVTATDQESQTDFGKLEKELGETDNVENKGNDQEDETNLISQAGISEISDNTTSVLGYPAKNFDDNDGGNKEIKGKGALAKTTPNTQTDSQNENPPYRQDEAGAISSEPSREALSFSQRLDDDTLLDKQLDEFIDNISTGFNENREEWKKSTRKKMKSFLLTKVMDGTFSQRSFDSCVTNNMPVQNFDSDNHITDVRGVKREQGAKGGPSSSQHSQANDPIKCTTESDAEIPYIDSEENRQGPPELSTPQTEGTKSLHDPSKYTTKQNEESIGIGDGQNHQEPSRQTEEKVDVKSIHGKKSSTPRPEARKPPLSQSSSPKIPAETNTKDVRAARREQSAKDGPSSSKHSQANDPTDPSKCTAAPDVEIPFIGSPENRQGPPEQSTPQTKGAKSLHESYRQAGKRDTTAMHLNRSLNAASSNKFSSVSGGEQNEKQIMVNVQLGKKKLEIALPCDTNHYFKWLHCLSDSCCLATLKNVCHIEGVDMQMLKSKNPVFIFSANVKDVTCIELVQKALKETVKQYDIIYFIFDWDLVRPEKDLIRFCNHWNDTKKESHVSLMLLTSFGRITFCLVGERPDVESMKNNIESELKRFSNIQTEEAVGLCTLNCKRDDTCIKIFVKMKQELENDFEVTISFESNSEIRFTATSKDAITGVIRKVDEISESVQSLNLPYEYLEFLNRSESARLYLEQQLRKRKKLKLHFLENDEYDTVQVFEENNTDLEGVNEQIQNWLFYIPSKDELCQIFSFDEGKKEFSRLVEENKGKVQMVLDGSKQPCCVGTVDIKEKTENILSRFRLKNDYVKVPSEEVWQFCAQRHVFQDIAKEASCEVKFEENKEYQWCVEVRGPVAFISKCCDKIGKEIRKVKSETILSIDYDSFDESTVANLIKKWNAEKRCFVNTKCVKAKAPAPWKKWIEKNGKVVKMTYFVNFNSSPEIHDDDLRLVLIPEEQTGAKSKNLCVPMPGQSITQISVPSSKTRDFVERGLKEVLKMNKEQWKKRHLIVDCKRIPEKELKNSMTIICYTLDNTAGSDSCITMCEFCDTRLEMFDCMTKLIDTYMKKKHFQVLEWKGRSIEMDVKPGQMAQQKGFDVLVNSTSWNLDLTAGLTSRSLLKAAGPGIQQECKKKYRGGIYMGEIAVTEGHNLNCKHVFHGYLPSYSTKENFQSLRRMIRSCLETADNMKMESIAFPALGTGSLGYNRGDVANVLFEEVEKYENEVRLGSLSRLCCVIYQDDIDAVEIFQKRHLKWNEDHKWKNISKEVMVTSDIPDVIEELYQVFQQLKRSTTTNLEPPTAEITKNMRLGNPPIEDAKNDHTKKQIQQSRQNANYPSEEKRCLLIKTKENSEKEHLNVWERNLREDFGSLAENIVCPFNSPNVALVQFATEKDLEDISIDDNFKKKYNLQKFPPQAVVGLVAVISPSMTELLKKKRITAKEIRSKSGALLRKNDTNALVLCGNVLEIKAAHLFFATLIKEDSHGITQEEQPVSKAAEHLIRGENLPEIIHNVSNINSTPNGKTMSRDDSKRYSLKQPPVTGINEISESRQIPPTVKQLDKPNVLEDIQCTDEDVTKLKYFHKNLMAKVKIITVPDHSVVALQFHDEDTKRRVKEYLDKIKHMPHVTCPVPNVADIAEKVAKKCSDDTFCYISSDRQQIEIIGITRDNVNKIKEELNMLSEIQMTEKTDESSKMPVLVTNEGVSVFVYCASLLDLQTPVDAIVCPLSKLSDLEYGLPKYIAETTRSEHDKKLRNIFEHNENIFPDHSVFSFKTENIKSCKHVVYVSTHRTPVRGHDNDQVACEQFLLQLMLQIFLKAEQFGIHTIAIPAICSGKYGFTKEICAQCYGTSVMKYSRTIQSDAQGLSGIHFVEKSAEMISYIESVFTQPDLVDTFEAKAQDSEQSSSIQESLYPYYTEDGKFCLKENLCLTVIDSNDLKHQKDRTLVYQAILSKMDKWKVITDPIFDEEKKQLKKSKQVAFFKNGFLTSKFEHIELPVFEKRMDLNTYGELLHSFYFSIFQEAEKQQLTKIVMPLYGFSKGQDNVTAICARCLSEEMKNFHTILSPKSKHLDVVVAVDDKPTKDIVIKEIGIQIESERAGFWQEVGNPNKRSLKRRRQVHKNQKQPYGRISSKITENRLKDFRCGTIEIQVTIPNGVQRSCHPNPGKDFFGRKETLYLPDNDLGRSIASMIVEAFKRKILYEVKTNTTQGIEKVVGNDISLISKSQNFPDPKQLQNLHDILKKKLES